MKTDCILIIEGGQDIIYAPEKGDKTVSEAFTACFVYGADGSDDSNSLKNTNPSEVLNVRLNREIAENITWNILSSEMGLEIDDTGRIIIDDTFLYGDINGVDIIISATADGITSEKRVIHVREPKQVTSFDIDIPENIRRADGAEIKLKNVTDQYGEPMECDISEIEWQFSHTGMEIKNGYLTFNIPVADPEIIMGFKATLGNAVVEKRFVLVIQKDYRLTEEKQKELADANVTYISDIDFNEPVSVDKDKYVIRFNADTLYDSLGQVSKISSGATSNGETKDAVTNLAPTESKDSGAIFNDETKDGSDALTYEKCISVDISHLAGNGKLFQVCTLYEDGSYDIADVESENGNITIPLSVNNLTNLKQPSSESAGTPIYAGEIAKITNTLIKKKIQEIEISPVFSFAHGNAEVEKDYMMKVGILDSYKEESLFGFCGKLDSFSKGVTFKNTDTSFVIKVPDGFYNVRIRRPMGHRTSVYINGESLGTNVGNPGTGQRARDNEVNYLIEDAWVSNGTLRLSLGEKDLNLSYVEIRRSPEIIPRKTHIYIGGDSTVSNYYPVEKEEPAPGRMQTGWGQTFAQFITDDMSVTNIAGGGTYAKSWYEMAFGGVIQNSQPGDYFIIHAGINDKSYSNREEMVKYLEKMIDECEQKDITVILTTAMQSPKFWKDANGNEIGEYESPEGGGLAAFMESIRELAARRNVFLVDVGKITSEWYGTVGRAYVTETYHLYNAARKQEEDTLHLSYAGALKISEIIATELKRMQAEGVTDYKGHTLDSLRLNVLDTYAFTYTDANGVLRTTDITAVKAVYRKYAQ